MEKYRPFKKGVIGEALPNREAAKGYVFVRLPSGEELQLLWGNLEIMTHRVRLK